MIHITSIASGRTTDPEVLELARRDDRDACTDGAVVADGFAGPAYVKLRADQPDPQTTSVCFRADGSEVHLGGRIDLVDSGGVPGTPTVESDNACMSTPLLSGEIGDPSDPTTHVPYEVSVDVNADEVWVCVHIDDLLRRVVVPIAQTPTVSFLPDATDPHPGTETPPTDSLLPSSSCQNNGGDRVVNADLGGAHLWLYTRQESSRVHACVRAEGASAAGGRLTVDTLGSPGVTPTVATFTDQAGQCDLNLITNAEPVTFSVRRSSSTNPAWLCVDVEGTQRQVKLGATTGAQTIVTFTPDP